MPQEKITRAMEGELIEVVQRVPVQAKCTENHGRWYCATHMIAFVNQMMKDFHISRGRHHLAWICSTHGYEQP